MKKVVYICSFLCGLMSLTGCAGGEKQVKEDGQCIFEKYEKYLDALSNRELPKVPQYKITKEENESLKNELLAHSGTIIEFSREYDKNESSVAVLTMPTKRKHSKM